MKKKLLLLSGLTFSGLTMAQIGINTQAPQGVFHIDSGKNNDTDTPDETDDVVVTSKGDMGIGVIRPSVKLEVNGKLKVNDIDHLEDTVSYPLAVDSRGVVGKANTASYLAYFTSLDITYAAPEKSSNLNSVNAGNTIVVPIALDQAIINTMDAKINNSNCIYIAEKGYYQIGAALNLFLSMAAGERFFVAINIQKSSDNGTTWESMAGIRPIIQSANTNKTPGGYNYPQVISPVIAKLNIGDLLRLVFYRTKVGSSLQGNAVTLLNVGPNSDYGISSYNFSISKL